MPKYKISGKSRDSDRKRVITHQGINEISARAHAEGEGIDVVEIIQLPEETPTERQIEYAVSLGINIPNGATKSELSDLISMAVDKDKPSDARHLQFAKFYGVDFTRYIGKKLLFDRIQEELIKPGNELNMISWFAFWVYRELVSGKINPELDDPRNAIFISIAQELVSDEKIIKSVKRYNGRDLIWFGEWTSPSGYLMSGGSIQTMAYKTVSKILRDKLSLTSQTKVNDNGGSKHGSSSGGKGCILTILTAIALPALAFLAYLANIHG
jgi:hypothetical protein